jgi:hypothetical protein
MMYVPTLRIGKMADLLTTVTLLRIVVDARPRKGSQIRFRLGQRRFGAHQLGWQNQVIPAPGKFRLSKMTERLVAGTMFEDGRTAAQTA